MNWAELIRRVRCLEFNHTPPIFRKERMSFCHSEHLLISCNNGIFAKRIVRMLSINNFRDHDSMYPFCSEEYRLEIIFCWKIEGSTVMLHNILKSNSGWYQCFRPFGWSTHHLQNPRICLKSGLVTAHPSINFFIQEVTWSGYPFRCSQQLNIYNLESEIPATS